LNYEESREFFGRVFRGEVSDSELREELVALYSRGETAEEIAGAMEVMKRDSLKVTVDPEFKDKLFDNCGTGGDKSGSFNISTTVAFVLSGAGLYVAKHGNRSITSKSGSGDVLEKLGFNLNLSPIQHSLLLQQSRFTFMFAPNHHPAMRHIMPVRKSIPHRTIFNILGPLTSPADVTKQLVGVFDSSFINRIATALKIVGVDRASVVSSRDGLDEVAISDITDMTILRDGVISESEIDPEVYGIKKAPFEAIRGGDADENAKTLLSILDGTDRGAKRDIVLLNSGVALYTDGIVRDIKDGIDMARETIDSGKAIQQFKMSIELSQKI
jgi:anthranilate phosphoribosyltransferase